MIGIERNEAVGKRQLGQVPELRIVPVGQPYSLRQSRHVQQHIARSQYIRGQLPVDLVQQPAQSPRQSAVQAAKLRLGRRRKALKDTNGVDVFLDAFSERLQITQYALYRGRGRFDVAKRGFQRQSPVVQSKEHGIGFRAIDLESGDNASCAT